MAKRPKAMRPALETLLKRLKVDRRELIDGILAINKGYKNQGPKEARVLQQAITCLEAQIADEK